MNAFFERLVRLISGPRESISIRDQAVQRYLQCIDEYNANYLDPDWLDTPRGIDVESYMHWFEEYHG